jgi:hypothetical protein
LTLEDDFNHYEAGHTEYDNLPPQMQGYADIINSIKLSRSIIPGGPSRLHIAGAVTQNVKDVLKNNTIFGLNIRLGDTVSLIAYGESMSTCYSLNSDNGNGDYNIFIPTSDSVKYPSGFIWHYDRIGSGTKRGSTDTARNPCCKTYFIWCTDNGCDSGRPDNILWYGSKYLSETTTYDWMGSTVPAAPGDTSYWKAVCNQSPVQAQFWIDPTHSRNYKTAEGYIISNCV